ncbi:MAG: hypothetical protein ABW318_11350 [Vicinamibacterales bacterium]
MANYLIVVPRGNTELFDLLSAAFRGHTGFNVVIDRRGSESLLADAERRTSRVAPGPDEIVIAERSDRADRPLAGGESPRSYPHVPVRRRRTRSSSAPRWSVVHGMSTSRGATAC